MRQVVVQEFVSLDGYAAGPDGAVDFIPASTQGDRSLGEEQMELMGRTDTLLLGRLTYEMFVGYWPNVTEGEEKGFADAFNGLTKVVFSRTLERAPWGGWNEGAVVPGDPVEEVSKRKAQPGKDLLVSGSLSIAADLIEAELVDEFRLVLCPVVLGSGRRLFPEGSRLQLRRDRATALDRGSVSLIYRAHGSDSG